MATEEAVVRVARLEGSGERKKSTNLESNFVGIRILNFKTLKLKHRIAAANKSLKAF